MQQNGKRRLCGEEDETDGHIINKFSEFVHSRVK